MLKNNETLQLDEDKQQDNQEDINISYKELDEKCDKIISKIKNRKNRKKRS